METVSRIQPLFCAYKKLKKIAYKQESIEKSVLKDSKEWEHLPKVQVSLVIRGRNVL
jgi:hypothetical protein